MGYSIAKLYQSIGHKIGLHSCLTLEIKRCYENKEKKLKRPVGLCQLRPRLHSMHFYKVKVHQTTPPTHMHPVYQFKLLAETKSKKCVADINASQKWFTYQIAK